MNNGPEIKTEQINQCLLCGRLGTTRYTNLPDRLFDTPGVWELQVCPACGLTWLSPRPVAEDIQQTYLEYFTHGADTQRNRMDLLLEKLALPVVVSKYGYGGSMNTASSRKLWGKILGLIPLFNDAALRYVMGLRGGAEDCWM